MLLCFSRLMVYVALARMSARVVFTCKFKIKSRKTIDLAPFFSLLPHFFLNFFLPSPQHIVLLWPILPLASLPLASHLRRRRKVPV